MFLLKFQGGEYFNYENLYKLRFRFKSFEKAREVIAGDRVTNCNPFFYISFGRKAKNRDAFIWQTPIGSCFDIQYKSPLIKMIAIIDSLKSISRLNFIESLITL